MGNFIIAAEANLLDYTATASSAAANFPASNLKLYNRPKLAWRSTAVTAQSIVFDFGSAKTIALAVFDWCNFVDGDFQNDAANTWSPPDATQAVEIAQNADTHRYGIYIPPSGFTRRYARLAIDAQTPTDGSGYFSLGRAMFFESVLTLTENPDAGFSWQTERFFAKNVFDGGGQERISLGSAPRRSGKFQWSDIDRVNNLDEIRQLALMDESQLIVVCENFTGDYSDFVVCFRDDPIPISWDSYQFATTGSLNFTESI